MKSRVREITNPKKAIREQEQQIWLGMSERKDDWRSIVRATNGMSAT